MVWLLRWSRLVLVLNHTSKEAMMQDITIPDMLSSVYLVLSTTLMFRHGISAWLWKYCLRRLINPTSGVPQALYFQDGLIPHNGISRKMQRTSGISVHTKYCQFKPLEAEVMMCFSPFFHVQEAETLPDECCGSSHL